MFDKNIFYENVCPRFFQSFETLWKIFSLIPMIFKKDINGETVFSPVCLHTPIVSFYFTSLSTAFEKPVGDYLTHIFSFWKL